MRGTAGTVWAKKEAAGGGPGRRGHGVMEVQSLSRSESRGGRTPNLEGRAIVPGACGRVDRPEGSIGYGTNVLSGPADKCAVRSEERRVGKECSARGARELYRGAIA